MTLAEVARHAGTSVAAASRTLNGRGGVRAEVREAVWAAARRLGYAPNAAARNLAMRRSGFVGLVMNELDRVAGTSYFSELVASIGMTVERSDWHAALLLSRDENRRRGLLHDMHGHVDGAVVTGHRAGDRLLAGLAARAFPVVALGRPIGVPALSYVDVDNVGGARRAVAHLLTQGRRRIAVLAGPQDTAWGLDRLAGYRAELESNGMPYDESLVEVCDFTFEAGWQGMGALLARRPDLDAVLSTSEALVQGALPQVTRHDRTVPDDVAVVTFDDGPAQEYSVPPLTVVRQPLRALGEELGRLILDRIRVPGDAVRHVLLDTTLRVRRSSVRD